MNETLCQILGLISILIGIYTYHRCEISKVSHDLSNRVRLLLVSSVHHSIHYRWRSSNTQTFNFSRTKTHFSLS